MIFLEKYNLETYSNQHLLWSTWLKPKYSQD